MFLLAKQCAMSQKRKVILAVVAYSNPSEPRWRRKKASEVAVVNSKGAAYGHVVHHLGYNSSSFILASRSLSLPKSTALPSFPLQNLAKSFYGLTHSNAMFLRCLKLLYSPHSGRWYIKKKCYHHREADTVVILIPLSRSCWLNSCLGSFPGIF